MTIRFTQRHMSIPVRSHEHIERLKGYDVATNLEYEDERANWYEFVKNAGNSAYVEDIYGNRAYTGGYISAGGNKYVRTYRDKVWTDNLLDLPVY